MSEPIRIAAWTNEHNRGFIGGHYIRPFGPYPKGSVHDGHAHWIDHMTFIEAGLVRVDWKTPDGREGAYIIEPPNFITIKAQAHHRFEALEDGTRWRCIFAEAEAEKLEGEHGAIPYNMGKPDV